MKRLFQILAIAVILAFSASSCAIFTEEPQVVERHYYAPQYNPYPGGVYYWYGSPYYTRPPYAAPRPPHHPPYAAPPRPPHHNPGYTPRPQPPRPEVHRPSPRPQRPSAPTVPAPPRQPANTPPVNQHKAPR